MAFRTWVKVLGATLGAGAVGGASQLGLAYGLGIVRLTQILDITKRDEWVAQLAWIAWFALTSAAAAGFVGRRLLPRRAGAGARAAIAVTAGLGAAIVVPLTRQPARGAHVQGVQPLFVIAVCAALAAAVGVFVAYATVSRAVARWSVASVGVTVWLIALSSTIPSLDLAGPVPAVRLGVLDAALLPDLLGERLTLFTMPAVALLCGLITAAVARRRNQSTVSVALAGLAGPALLTISYVIAGPGTDPRQYEAVPYWAALTATVAGLLGSVLIAVLPRAAEAGTNNSPDAAQPGHPGAARPGHPGPAQPGHPGPAQQGPAGAPRPGHADPAHPGSPGAPQRPNAPRQAPAMDRPTSLGSARPTSPPPSSGAGREPARSSPPAPAQGRPATPQPAPAGAFQSRPQPHPTNTPPTSPPPVKPPLPTMPISGAGRDGHPQQRPSGPDNGFVDWVHGLGNK